VIPLSSALVNIMQTLFLTVFACCLFYANLKTIYA